MRFYHLRVTEGQHNHAAASYCARCNYDLLYITDKLNFDAQKIRSYQNFLTFQAITFSICTMYDIIMLHI